MYATSTVTDLVATSVIAWIVGFAVVLFLAFFGGRR